MYIKIGPLEIQSRKEINVYNHRIVWRYVSVFWNERIKYWKCFVR